MPRQSGKIDEAEREICHRVRFIRESINWSQAKLSKALGVSRNVLVGVEYARTPLRFNLGIRLGMLTGYSLKWIAEGVEPKKQPFAIHAKLLDSIPANSLFTESWKYMLKMSYEQAVIENKRWIQSKGTGSTLAIGDVTVGGLAGVGFIGADDVLGYLTADFKRDLKSIPPHLLQSFYAQIMNAKQDFIGANIVEIHERDSRKNDLSKKELTEKVDSLTNSTVNAVLPKLIKRLNNATKSRGSKSKLAAWLGVHRQSVTDWLSRKQEPGGEITLKLLQWVEQQERQK